MLLLRSSRLAALARSRPAFSSKPNRQSVAVAVASPTRKAEECAKDERISSNGGKKRSSASVLSANKQSAPSVVASALSRSGGEASSSSSDRASEALVVAAALQQPEVGSKALSSPEEEQSNKSSSSSPSEIQALAARLWSAYDAALTTHPVAVKSATSFVGFLLGDLIAQSIVGLPYDARRTLRLVAFGVFMDGPIGKKMCFSCSLKTRRTSKRQAHSNKRGR